MLTEVRGTLAVIAENGQIIAQLPKLDTLSRAGKTSEAQALAATLAIQGRCMVRHDRRWIRRPVAQGNPCGQTRSHGSIDPQRKELARFQNLQRQRARAERRSLRSCLRGEKTGIAVMAMTTPAKRHVEFHVQFNISPSAQSKNGGIHLANPHNLATGYRLPGVRRRFFSEHSRRRRGEACSSRREAYETRQEAHRLRELHRPRAKQVK